MLFHGAQSTVNSVRCHQARSKMGESVQGKEYQLLWRVSLAVRLMELSGGMVRLTEVVQES
jgi:hypothetical protein